MQVVDRGVVPFLNMIKMINSMSLLLMWYLFRKEIPILMRGILVVVIVGFAFLTYGKLIIILHVGLLLYLSRIPRLAKIITVVLLSVNFFAIYQFMLSARSSNDGYFDGNTENSYSTTEDFIVDRLNYYRILSSVADTDYRFDRLVYLDNIIGLIPRAVWKEKPEIGLNTNRIGRQLGILSNEDRTTSAGIGIVAETYAVLGKHGFWIPGVVYGILFICIRLFDNDTFTYLVIMQFTVLDTFTFVLPLMFTLLLIMVLFNSK
jgi:hypothetical protein